jgi:hypothetical protein
VKIHHLLSVHGSGILAPNISKVFVITSTQRSTLKKRRLDPIDSSTGSHQDEGNSGFINLIDPASDYLPDQLRFFLNQLRLRWRQCIISDSHNIRTTMDSLKSEHAPYWLRVTSGQLWNFKLIEDASNRLHAYSDYHSVLKDGSHNQSEQDVKDFVTPYFSKRIEYYIYVYL